MLEEAQIWPRDILERFLVTGERPRWISDPGRWLIIIWWFPRMGVSQNGWSIMTNPIEMDDLEVP